MTRVAVFAAVLAVLFVAAVGAGTALGPLRDPDEAAADAHGMAMEGPAGVAASANGFRLELEHGHHAEALAFRILDRDGKSVRDYDVAHEKRMHVIVVRRDLTGFQHLHPRLGADGTWHVTAAPLAAGEHRLFADFTTDGEKTVLATDLHAAGSWTPAGLPPTHRAARVDGYVVSLDPGEARVGEQTLSFRVTRGGKTATVGRYLGARGHLVILRTGDLAYLHAHADADALEFDTDFPTPGSYRAFLQFRAGGSVHTAAFTIEAR